MSRNAARRRPTSFDSSSRVPVDEEEFNDATMLVYVLDEEGEPVTGIPPEYLAATTIEVEGGRKYEVRSIVAKGGMGIVYEARDMNCDRTVALKVLLARDKHLSESKKRFVGEARSTSKLEHPNIVPIHELGKDVAGNVFYSMKFVKGVTLGAVLNDLRKGRPETIEQFPLGRLLTVFQKTCDAVAFAHANGVVHRDLKPGNIMIGSFGEVLVLDWGLARAVAAPPEITRGRRPPPAPKMELKPKGGPINLDTIRVETGESGLHTIKTLSGTVLGTPGFMAPEQVDKSGFVDERSDIYALGAILYSILTLRSPVREKDIPRLLQVILEGEIAAPVKYNETDVFLPHCPGLQVPNALSEIAMRAMAVSPSDRYQSVKELQQEIEDYQNGVVWHLVVDEDFGGPGASLERWEPLCGKCEIANRELRMHGGELQMLLLRREMPLDVRIEWECRQEGTYLNDVACLLSGIRGENDWETSISGYAFKYGAYTNTLNVLTRCDKRIWQETATPLAPGRRFKMRAERVGSRLRLVVNGKEVFTVTDPQPLIGANRTVVGLLGWAADTRVSRLRVYSLGTPWKSDILDIAERHLEKGHYTTAKDLFREVMQSFPDALRLARARKGHEAAVQRDELQKSLPGWRERLQQAWPGSGVEIAIEHDGLAVEMSRAGIEDLSPLAGMPVTSLVCWGNRITSLEPLRGMPLKNLNCAGNPVRTLEPLRELPLESLRCEACGVTTLEPLREMRLVTLNCSENRLSDGLEPLRGLPLSWLACTSCGIRSIQPLAGMPMTWLFCDGNEIGDLEPLRGAPLIELSCRGNRIANLDALIGTKLNTLHCDDNAIESIEPLKGLPISSFSCVANRLSSLDSLKNVPLSALICGANRLLDIGPFVKSPPKTFFFDCDTISTQNLEWIRTAWSRDLRLAEYTRTVDVLMALRRKDVARLRERASGFQGRRYLFVPKFLRWEEARDLCASLGGHLATIAGREENEHVASLFPVGGSWFWIGLNVREDGRPEWVTGEPVGYRAFVSEMQESTPGPRCFSGGYWCCDLVRDAHNAFMIEWEE